MFSIDLFMQRIIGTSQLLLLRALLSLNNATPIDTILY
jgi:hypothetical protein